MDTQVTAYYLAWICIIHLSVFSFILFFKKDNKKANVTLAIFMLMLVAIHASHLLLLTDMVYKYYWLNNLCFLLLFLEGPVYFRYTTLMAGAVIDWKKYLWLHILPFLFPVWYIISFLFKDALEIKTYYQYAKHVQPLDATIVLAVVTIQAAVYWLWSVKILNQYNKRLKSKLYKSQLSLQWLTVLTIILLISALLVVPMLLFVIQSDISVLYIYMPVITMTIYLTLFYKSINFPGTEYEKRLIREQVRQRISRDMHDELGAGITKIALLSELARKNNEEDDLKLSEISGNAKRLSENLKEIIWDLNPESSLFSNMLSYIREYASDFLYDSGINYFIELPNQEPDFIVSYEAKRNLIMIIKESLNNILKHSGANQVNLRLEAVDGLFLLTIEDNGKGIGHPKGSQGNGLKNMAIRASQIGADFTYQSNNGGLSVRVKNINLS